MSDIPSSITKVQIEATRFRSAVSEFLLQQMGATINGLIDEVEPTLKTEIFTAGGTFNVPSTVSRVIVWGIGGGGGGSSGLGGGSGDGSDGANSTFGALATFRFGRGGVLSATLDNSVIFGGGGALPGQDSPFSAGGLAGGGATPANAGGGGAGGIGSGAAGGDGGGAVTDGVAGADNTGEGGGGGGGFGNPGGNGGGAAMFASRILTVTPSAAITITIGAGGLGAPSGVSAAGGNGGSGIIVVSYVSQ